MLGIKMKLKKIDEFRKSEWNKKSNNPERLYINFLTRSIANSLGYDYDLVNVYQYLDSKKKTDPILDKVYYALLYFIIKGEKKEKINLQDFKVCFPKAEILPEISTIITTLKYDADNTAEIFKICVNILEKTESISLTEDYFLFGLVLFQYLLTYYDLITIDLAIKNVNKIKFFEKLIAAEYRYIKFAYSVKKENNK